MKIFNSVAQMKLSYLTAGQLVETSGYYTPGDGGAGKYLIATTQVVDNFGNHDLANTNVAILQYIDSINIKQFGAVGDDSIDDTAAIQGVFDAIMLNGFGTPFFGGTIIIPAGIYKHTGLTINGSVAEPAYVNIIGEAGYGACHLKCYNAAIPALKCNNLRYFQFDNFLVGGINCTGDGIVFTSPAIGAGTGPGTLNNISAEGFISGAGMRFGEADNDADDITINGGLIKDNNIGILIDGIFTANLTFINQVTVSNNIAAYQYNGDPAFAGFEINVIGGSSSSEAILFLIKNPTHLNVIGHHSEWGAVDGTFLQVGEIGNTLGTVIRVSLTGCQVFIPSSQVTNVVANIYAPANLSVRDCNIGMGRWNLSGEGSTTKSRIHVDNSSLSYPSDPLVYDAASGSAWMISKRGVSRSIFGSSPLDDSDVVYNSSGNSKTLYSFEWSASAANLDVAQSSLPTSAEVVTATNVITAAENGKTFYLNAAGGFSSALPAPALGLKYTFIVSVAPTTAYIINTNAGANVLYGTYLDTIGELTYFSAQDTINFVASTALVGDILEVESDGVNWHCKAITGANGGITVSVV